MRRARSRVPQVLVIVLSLIGVVLIATGIWLYFQSDIPTSSFSADDVQVENMDPAAKTGALPDSPANEKSPGENQFGYRISQTPSFSAGDGRGALNLENPAFNDYIMVVEVSLSNDPSVLYRSQYLPPNHYIETIELTTIPPVGEHAAMAYINVIDPVSYALVEILDCPLVLTVQ